MGIFRVDKLPGLGYYEGVFLAFVWRLFGVLEGFNVPAIRAIGSVASKWAERAGSAGPQYAAGVATPKADWGTNAAAGQANWTAGVQSAAASKSFSKGVQKAGTPKWQQAATGKGAQRFGPGVQGAQPAYQKGFEPFASVISSTTLPPKYAKGDPRNVQRVATMAAALRAAKMGAS